MVSSQFCFLSSGKLNKRAAGETCVIRVLPCDCSCSQESKKLENSGNSANKKAGKQDYIA